METGIWRRAKQVFHEAHDAGAAPGAAGARIHPMIRRRRPVLQGLREMS